MQGAARKTGLSAKVLREGTDRQSRYEAGESDRPGLRHRRLPHLNGGEVILFDCDELAEDLARLPCEWCEEPAPGDSGRCKRHQAKKYPTVELVCDWEDCPRGGEPFTRYGSVHHARKQRGDEHTFCGDRCEMLYLKAHHPQFASPHPPFDAETARERYERLESHFAEAKAELDLPLEVHQVAAATYTSPAVIRTHSSELGGQVVVIEGAQRLLLPADAPERYRAVWAGRPQVDDEHWTAHRERYLDPDWMVKREEALGRLERREDERELRERVAARRKVFTPKRKGRRPRGSPAAKHFQWERRFSEIESDAVARYEVYHVDGDAPPSHREIARQLANEYGVTADAVRKAVERVRAWHVSQSLACLGQE